MFIEWLKENIGSVIAGAVLAVILFFTIRSIVKRRKQGVCNCGCPGCSGCMGACGHCGADDKEDKNEAE